MKRFALTTSILATAALLAACSASDDEEPEPATTTSAHTDTPAPPLNYVALGDSYAAMGSRSAPTEGPESCFRSTDNYPSNLLQKPNIHGLDSSCSSAQTEHVLHDWDNGTTIPAQVNSLRPDTSLVTLSIGGNDINFGAIAGCMYGRIDSTDPSSCEAQRAEPTDEMLSALPTRLDQVHEEIKRRSPHARVIVTGYLPMLTTEGTCGEAGSISLADKSWSVALTGRLNAVLADAASRHGAEFVLPADADQHTACAKPLDRWVDISGIMTDSYPMHPTAAGQKAMSDAVFAAIRDD